MIIVWVKLYLIWRRERRWEIMGRRERKSSNIIAYGWVDFDSSVCNQNSLGKAKELYLQRLDKCDYNTILTTSFNGNQIR